MRPATRPASAAFSRPRPAPRSRAAARQVERRGRQAFRLVLPADVIRRDLRAVDDDLLYVFGTERLAGLELAQSVQGRVVACDAGVELERDAHRLPGLAEARGELGEPEAIV